MKKTTIIFPSAFMVATGLGLYNLGLIFYASEVFGASPAKVGWLFATWAGSYAFGCVVVRPRSEFVPARYLTAAATLAIGVLSLALQLVPAPEGFPILYGINALTGLALSHYWPPLMGWLSAGVEGNDLSRLTSRYNCCWCTGMILGPFLAGWFSEIWVRLPIFLGSALFLGTSAYIGLGTLKLPHSKHESNGQTEAETDEADNQDQSTLFRYPAWAGLFANFFGMGVLGTVFPLICHNQFGISKGMIGLLFLVRTGANVTTFHLLGKTSIWHFRITPMLCGQLVFVLVFACLTVARSVPAMMILLVVAGMSMSLSYSSSLFHGVSGSSNRSGRMAIHEALLASGIVAGSAGGGMIYEAFGVCAVYLFCSALLFMAVLTQFFLWRTLVAGNQAKA